MLWVVLSCIALVVLWWFGATLLAPQHGNPMMGWVIRSMAIELKIYMLKSPDTNSKGCFIGAWLGSESISQQSLIGNQRCCKTKDGKMHKRRMLQSRLVRNFVPGDIPTWGMSIILILVGYSNKINVLTKFAKLGIFLTNVTFYLFMNNIIEYVLCFTPFHYLLR